MMSIAADGLTDAYDAYDSKSRKPLLTSCTRSFV